MTDRWPKYRLIIFGILILSFFIARTILPLFKKDESPKIPSLPAGFNRSINNLIISKHAQCRMECRDITVDEVKEILHDGNINYMKSNLTDERGPSYALEGYSHDKQHLRVVFAPKENEMVVVTCIDLDKEAQCDCN